MLFIANDFVLFKKLSAIDDKGLTEKERLYDEDNINTISLRVWIFFFR